MIKKLIFYTVILIFTSINSFSQSKNHLNEIVGKYKVRAIESLYFDSISKKLITDYLELSFDEFDSEFFSQRIYIFQEDAEIIKFIDYLNKKTSNYDKKKIYHITNHIEIWCQLSESLQLPYIFDIENLSEFHEIIANIPETKHLIDRYLSVEGQYWGSLSSSQTSEVYYDVMQYLIKLDAKNKLKFLKDYFETAYEIEKS